MAEYLTSKELADRFKLTKKTLYRLSESGNLQKPIRIGISYRWRVTDIEKFERESA